MKIFKVLMRKIDKLFGPFGVIKAYSFILLWWLIIFVTLYGPVVDAFNQKEGIFIYFINSGTLYYSVITLLFSFVVTNWLDVLFEYSYNKVKEIPFLHYYVVTTLLAVLLSFICIFLYTSFRSIPLLQILVSLFGYGFSFYLYCVSYMHRVREELQQYSLSYDEQKKNNSNKIQKRSKKKSSDGLVL